MKIKTEGSMTIIETEAYQGKNGAIYLNWYGGVLRLKKKDADMIARDIEDFDQDDYNEFYN